MILILYLFNKGILRGIVEEILMLYWVQSYLVIHRIVAKGKMMYVLGKRGKDKLTIKFKSIKFKYKNLFITAYLDNSTAH